MINRSLALVCAPVVALVLAIGDPITHRTDDQSGLGHGSRVALNSPADPPSAPPDIVLLVLDDHPPLAPSFYSALPNIKALFQDQGSNFSNFWANFSKCCPGRATLFTGQWAHHHGVTKNDALLFDPRESLATELSSVGYHTILCGKYMNGLSSLTDKTPDGWDDVAVKDSGPYFNYSAWINGVREKHANLESDYSADVMSGHCLQLLDGVPPGKPLFAVLTPNATHGGKDENGLKEGTVPVPAPRHRGDARCTDAGAWKPANYNEADVSDKPSYIANLPLLAEADGWPLQKACEAMLSVDEWLGATIQLLKDQGRYGNTLFVLTGDNGMGWGAHRWLEKTAPYTAQMPLVISWPGAVGPTPSDTRTLLTNADIAPTLCEIGGCSMGPFPNGFGVDGQSFAGLIAGDRYTSVPDRDAIVLESHSGSDAPEVPAFRAILTSTDHDLGPWLLVRYETQEQELYDLRGGPCLTWDIGDPGDPCMMRNKAYKSAYRPIRQSLRTELDAMW